MNDAIRRSWWLVPAVLVGIFDVMLLIGQLAGTLLGIEFEPRVGTRLAASAAWLLAAGCVAIGIALRNRRPQRAGMLVIVGSLPAVLIIWMVLPPLLGIAAIVGAIHHMTTSPAPTKAPA